MMKLYFLSFLFLFMIFSCDEKEDPQLINLLKKGKQELDKESYGSAKTFFFKALALKGEGESKALVNRDLAYVYNQQGNQDSAFYYFDRGADLSKEGSFIFYSCSIGASICKKEFKNALNLLNESYLIYPNQIEISNLLCAVYSGEYDDVFFDPENAEKFAKKAFELRPNRKSKEQLGRVYFQNEKYLNAAKLFSELVYSCPSNLFYQFYFGQALFFNGEESRGIPYMKKAASKNDSCLFMFNEIFSSK